MTIPIQVWAPFMEVSPVKTAFLRDLKRAQAAWVGEERVWLQPASLQEIPGGVVRWSETQQASAPVRCSCTENSSTPSPSTMSTRVGTSTLSSEPRIVPPPITRGSVSPVAERAGPSPEGSPLLHLAGALVG
jgi:hypothetical protein